MPSPQIYDRDNIPLRHRMPVILPLGREKNWLAPGEGTIFKPIPPELISIYPVSPEVNRPTFNVPAAIVPLELPVPQKI
jgi:putative SOS response-associated peptidase YedK